MPKSILPGLSLLYGMIADRVSDAVAGVIAHEIEPVPNPKPTHEMLQKMVPDELGAGLFAHCCEEISILADFLPTVYRIHNADTQRPKGTQ